MREQIRKMIDEAKQPQHKATRATEASAHTHLDPSQGRSSQGGELLGAEAVRLARLALSVHLSRAAKQMANHSANRSSAARLEPHFHANPESL